MKITGIKTFIVDGGFRPWTFVKVETDEGLVGWGDCTDWDAAPAIASTVDMLTGRMIGRDPMRAEETWWELAGDTVRQSGGIAYKAMSGIDSALWDIRGKALGAPVWQLLGGKMRDELPMYWSHCGSTRARHASRLGVPPVKTTDDLRRLSEEVLAKGYTGIKTNLMPLDDLTGSTPFVKRLSVGDASPATVRNAGAIVSTFRDALGPDVGIAVDIALNFKLGGAIKLARALEPYDLMWLETETFDPEALRVIRQSTRTTICTGESLFGIQGYKPYLERYSQDVIMPDFAWNGITMGKRICDLALAYDTPIAPHNCHSPLNTLVSANICAVIPNFLILEFDQDDAPWRDDLMTHPFEVKNGSLKVPDRPGLGSDLIEAELEKHRWNG
ncbi:MAG: mandelate racemase/muconate lactonizing enzyme family protein [Dehalococcoidia bacterium]